MTRKICPRFDLDSAFFMLAYLGSIAACGLWFEFWATAIRYIVTGINPKLPHSDNTLSPEWDPTKWPAVILCLSWLEVGLMFLGVMSWPIIQSVSRGRASSSE